MPALTLLYSEEGEILVSEVNGIPGWEGLQQVCSYNVASEIANYVLANKTKKDRIMCWNNAF